MPPSDPHGSSYLIPIGNSINGEPSQLTGSFGVPTHAKQDSLPSSTYSEFEDFLIMVRFSSRTSVKFKGKSKKEMTVQGNKRILDSLLLFRTKNWSPINLHLHPFDYSFSDVYV